MPTPEQHARILIDAQLSAAGWTVVAPGFGIGQNPTALCESTSDTGRADYVLYLDGKACGIIEAKRSDHSLQGVQEQSANYTAFRKWDDPTTCWQSPLPFRFEANGPQIQFTDARDPKPRARPIFHFPKPQHLRDLLTKAASSEDTLRRRLTALPVSHPLDTFLAAAVTGQLTRAWREQHPDTEPSSATLERILKQREEQWSGKGKYKGPEAPTIDYLSSSPKTWCPIRLDLMADVVNPQPSHRTPPRVEGGIPYVGFGGIDKNDRIDFENVRRVSLDFLAEHNERYQLQPGDFIFGKIGTLGKPVVLEEPFECTLSANVILVQPRNEALSPKFAFYFLQSPIIQAMLEKTSRATTQAAFVIKRMRGLGTPVPPLAEQHQIVAEVEARTTAIDHLEAELNRQITRSNRLRQSTLAAAFSGKLVEHPKENQNHDQHQDAHA